jgi:hypothetical protein
MAIAKKSGLIIAAIDATELNGVAVLGASQCCAISIAIPPSSGRGRDPRLWRYLDVEFHEIVSDDCLSIEIGRRFLPNLLGVGAR